MSSLHDILKKNIKKMVASIEKNKKGNIHPLIMQEVERLLISLVLEETKHNYFVASKVLGISRSTLYRKLERLEIDVKKSTDEFC